jgi:hypothetical protein
MVSSFVTAILSTYLWRIGLIDPSIIFVFAILTIVGAIGSKEERL